mmetsp:Transcript_9971/g.23751  ORF Transcript_9971/g.23751 Transcript_9971/m.23751 type:complete len:201 (+) Transcript_9971:122-724(+)
MIQHLDRQEPGRVRLRRHRYHRCASQPSLVRYIWHAVPLPASWCLDPLQIALLPGLGDPQLQLGQPRLILLPPLREQRLHGGHQSRAESLLARLADQLLHGLNLTVVRFQLQLQGRHLLAEEVVEGGEGGELPVRPGGRCFGLHLPDLGSQMENVVLPVVLADLQVHLVLLSESNTRLDLREPLQLPPHHTGLELPVLLR